MKQKSNIKQKHLKLGLLIVCFSCLSLFFTNCSQPGDIQLNNNSIPTSTDDGPSDTAASTPVDDADNDPLNGEGSGGDDPGTTTPPPIVKYKSVSGSVTVKTAVNNKVDVLIIIDNSGSMSYEQAEMATRFSGFVDTLNGLDWQLGIATTDVVNVDQFFSDGRLLPFPDGSYILNSKLDMAVAQDMFGKTIQRPKSEGSGREQGVRATYRVIERSELPADKDVTHNRELFRAGANLAVIIVSDANETPSEGGSVYSNYPSNLLNYIKTKWPEKISTIHSIIVKSGDEACAKDPISNNEFYGKAYEVLSNATSGIIGSVCEANYSNQLRVMGQDIKDKVNAINLACEPVDSDADGIINFMIKDDQGVEIKGVTINGSVVSFATELPAGQYTLQYSCVDTQ